MSGQQPINMSREKQLETCVIIMAGLLVFWFINHYKGLVTIAILIGLIGAFVPALARWIHWAWYKLAEVMGFVMSKVLLSVVFFVFLFPIAMLYKLTKKDTLQLKKSPGSYWTERNHSYVEKDLEHGW